MNIHCEKCNTDFILSNKKFAKRRGKTHKICWCPECGAKNFVPILLKYFPNEKSTSII